MQQEVKERQRILPAGTKGNKILAFLATSGALEYFERGEMVYGACKSSRPDYFMEKLENIIMPNIGILSFDEGAAKVYEKLRAGLEKKDIFIRT